MRSTDEARLRRFYRRRLRPAAEELRARGVGFFPLGPEPEASSWYEEGPSGEPEFVELEPEDLERALREHWGREGLSELVALVGPLAELAKKLETPREDPGDVSPFIYVMY